MISGKHDDKRGQAAFEYLVTYGWAILAAIIAIGALAYFGFINPSNLLPNKCNFGRQLECQEYQILDNGDVKIIFRNNFGKPISIIDIDLVEDPGGVTGAHPFSSPVYIPVSDTNETIVTLDPDYRRSAGEKVGVNLIVEFTRSDMPGPNHTIAGYLFTAVTKT
ncbi:hypothetical protein JW826_00125 [Candidatus Woesearchaeota archaeon]|nr:hypothetical protein [Candidatus Woesearchaeota archaeon]